MNRNRCYYFSLIFLVIVFGLTSRKMSDQLPKVVNLYLGDALWALMIFLMAGFILQKYPTGKITFMAGTFCTLVEITQLYHAPWIDALRSSALGGLILGFGFLWSDILAYSLGICFGAFAEKIFSASSTISSSSPGDDHL